MYIVIQILVMIAALLAVASGVWVALALFRTLTRSKNHSEPHETGPRL